MTTKKDKSVDEESPYAKDHDEMVGGKPVGPEHDGSFHAPDFYDVETGERIPTDWDTEAQANDPGIGAPPTDGGSSGPTPTPTSKATVTKES